MTLSLETVQHVARLARIGLTAHEEIRFQKELVGVFGLIAELKEANTEEQTPMSNAHAVNRMRNDAVLVSGMAADIIALFPKSKDGFNKVRAVF